MPLLFDRHLIGVLFNARVDPSWTYNGRGHERRQYMVRDPLGDDPIDSGHRVGVDYITDGIELSGMPGTPQSDARAVVQTPQLVPHRPS